jgi:hypothetical protein
MQKGMNMSWIMQHRVERRASRMHEMMKRLDVDPRILGQRRHGDAYAEARARCFFCGTSDKCLRWLDASATTNRKPAFCPNLSLLEACRRIHPTDYVSHH